MLREIPLAQCRSMAYENKQTGQIMGFRYENLCSSGCAEIEILFTNEINYNSRQNV